MSQELTGCPENVPDTLSSSPNLITHAPREVMSLNIQVLFLSFFFLCRESASGNWLFGIMGFVFFS